MSKLLSKKVLFLCLAIGLAVIIAGAVLAGVLGYNADSTMKDYTAVEVSDLAYASRSEAVQDQLRDFCRGEIEKEYKVTQYEYFENNSTGGATLRFTVNGTVDAAFCDSLEAAVAGAGIEGVTSDLVTVTYHIAENAPYYDFVWRTAVGLCVAFVILFVYMAIRYRLGMGAVALLAAVHDAAVVLALVAILRIPSGVALAGVAAFVVFLSAALNLFVFGRMRKNFRSEEFKNSPAEDTVSLSVREMKGTVLAVAVGIAVAVILLGVAGAVIGFDMTCLMIAALFGVLVTVYSSLILSPSLYALIRKKSDAIRAEKAKYNYVSDKKKDKAEKPAETVTEA